MIKVKPLLWGNGTPNFLQKKHPIHMAIVKTGRYYVYVSDCGGKWYWEFRSVVIHHEAQESPTAEEAKKACFEHWSKIVLESIEVEE